MELKDLKKEYGLLEKKHNLPSFKELNEDFEIDKIDKESDCLLRVVRKVMMEKIVNSLTFIETLINPINAPRIYFLYIKTMPQDDKKELDRIYKVLTDLTLESLSLEIDHEEKNEAELVIKLHKKWNELKPGFKQILENMKKPGVPESEKSKSYFG